MSGCFLNSGPEQTFENNESGSCPALTLQNSDCSQCDIDDTIEELLTDSSRQQYTLNNASDLLTFDDQSTRIHVSSENIGSQNEGRINAWKHEIDSLDYMDTSSNTSDNLDISGKECDLCSSDTIGSNEVKTKNVDTEQVVPNITFIQSSEPCSPNSDSSEDLSSKNFSEYSSSNNKEIVRCDGDRARGEYNLPIVLPLSISVSSQSENSTIQDSDTDTNFYYSSSNNCEHNYTTESDIESSESTIQKSFGQPFSNSTNSSLQSTIPSQFSNSTNVPNTGGFTTRIQLKPDLVSYSISEPTNVLTSSSADESCSCYSCPARSSGQESVASNDVEKENLNLSRCRSFPLNRQITDDEKQIGLLARQTSLSSIDESNSKLFSPKSSQNNKHYSSNSSIDVTSKKPQRLWSSVSNLSHLKSGGYAADGTNITDRSTLQTSKAGSPLRSHSATECSTQNNTSPEAHLHRSSTLPSRSFKSKKDPINSLNKTRLGTTEPQLKPTNLALSNVSYSKHLPSPGMYNNRSFSPSWSRQLSPGRYQFSRSQVPNSQIGSKKKSSSCLDLNERIPRRGSGERVILSGERIILAEKLSPSSRVADDRQRQGLPPLSYLSRPNSGSHYKSSLENENIDPSVYNNNNRIYFGESDPLSLKSGKSPISTPEKSSLLLAPSLYHNSSLSPVSECKTPMSPTATKIGNHNPFSDNLHEVSSPILLPSAEASSLTLTPSRRFDDMVAEHLNKSLPVSDSQAKISYQDQQTTNTYWTQPDTNSSATHTIDPNISLQLLEHHPITNSANEHTTNKIQPAHGSTCNHLINKFSAVDVVNASIARSNNPLATRKHSLKQRLER